MPDCEGKECYERAYQTRNVTVTTVGGVAAAGLAPPVRTAASNAIKAKAERRKVVNCPDPACECVRYVPAQNGPWSEWKTRQVTTTVDVAGAAQAVVGTVERRSRRENIGYCEDPNELVAFLPGEWDVHVAVALKGRKTESGRRRAQQRGSNA